MTMIFSAEFFFVRFGGKGEICYTPTRTPPNFPETIPPESPKFRTQPNLAKPTRPTRPEPMTAPAQILANALQSAVDAVCNFARFVVNESRTRLTPPPPPPPPRNLW